MLMLLKAAVGKASNKTPSSTVGYMILSAPCGSPRVTLGHAYPVQLKLYNIKLTLYHVHPLHVMLKQ